MYICVCKGITDHHIHQAVSDGTQCFRKLRKELGLASQCGKCGMHAREVFQQSVNRDSSNHDLFYAAG